MYFIAGKKCQKHCYQILLDYLSLHSAVVKFDMHLKWFITDHLLFPTGIDHEILDTTEYGVFSVLTKK